MSSSETKGGAQGNKVTGSNNRPKPGKPKPVPKPNEKEQKLQEKIKKLKERIVMLECNLDPIKIKKELDLSDPSLINMLTEANLDVMERLQQLENNTSGDSKKSNDKERHVEVEKLEKEKKKHNAEMIQKDKEITKSGKTKPVVKRSDNEKRLQEENIKLEERIVTLECNLDPAKLKKQIDEMTNMASIRENESANGSKGLAVDSVEKKHTDLQGEINRLNNVNDSRKKQLLDAKSKAEELQKKVDQMKLENKELAVDIVEKKQTELQGEINRLNNVNDSRKKQILDAKSKAEELQKKVDQMKLENKELAVDIVEKKQTELQGEINRLNNLNNSRKKSEQTQTSNDNLPVDVQKHNQVLLQENNNKIEKLEEKVKRLSEDNNEVNMKLDIANQSVKDKTDALEKSETVKTQLQKEKTKLEQEYSEYRQRMEEQVTILKDEKANIKTDKDKVENECSSLREQLKVVEWQVVDLKNGSANETRLSKDVDANIMNENPNITELSDENRPTKLSEKFCEIYDNEWTDAFEEAENEFKTEEKGIDHLYKTLLDVFDFCKKKSVEHAITIRNSVMTLPNSPNGRPKTAEIGVTFHRQLKDIRKSFAPMLVESVFQNYLKEKKLNLSKKNNTERFIRKCVEICWLMNSQDPPVILDTTVVTGKSFDSDKFRTYTKTGKSVDFVVWPPMLLHMDQSSVKAWLRGNEHED